MTRILLLSNGHGEDLSGALIAQALKIHGHKVEALPFVGRGRAYLEIGIKILGKSREFSTGGLGYTSIRGRFTELLQGQVFYLLGRLFQLLLVAKDYDLLLVVGDVVPVFAAWLTRRRVVTYLVAYSSHYEGRLRLPWPCASCLLSPQFLGIFSRDQLTADDLTSQLRRPVFFVGNPFMDPVLTPQLRLPETINRLGLLPGSRRPELDQNICLLLGVLEFLPSERLQTGSLSLDMALVDALDCDSLAQLANLQGWKLMTCEEATASMQLIRGPCIVNIHRGAFVKVLQSSDVLMCMAGTATEQAVGLAKPVVQLPGYGPQFTPSFAEAQRRLLGPTVFCAEKGDEEKILLKNTARLILEVLDRTKLDLSLQQECIKQARLRLGEVGGGIKIAQETIRLLNPN